VKVRYGLRFAKGTKDYDITVSFVCGDDESLHPAKSPSSDWR